MIAFTYRCTPSLRCKLRLSGLIALMIASALSQSSAGHSRRAAAIALWRARAELLAALLPCSSSSSSSLAGSHHRAAAPNLIILSYPHILC